MMVAKEQNGHDTRSGMLACCISSSCIFLRAREKREEGRISWRIDRGNWCSHEPENIEESILFLYVFNG